MKTILANGKSYKLGRNPPNQSLVQRKFRLRNYAVAAPPPPPAKTNYSTAAMESISNIFGNDVEGDCTIACAAHVTGVLTGNNASGVFMPTLDQVNAMYSACEGPPGYPAIDEGCDEFTVLQYWKNTGLAGHQIQNWLTVDATNVRECQTALWLFENLVLTVDLPDAWVNPFPSADGFTWNVEGDPDPENGHCIACTDYDFTHSNRHRFKIATWGMLGNLTPAALAKYFVPSADGGCYVVLSQESIIKGIDKAPNGLDWDQLQSDFALFG